MIAVSFGLGMIGGAALVAGSIVWVFKKPREPFAALCLIPDTTVHLEDDRGATKPKTAEATQEEIAAHIRKVML